MKRFIVFSGEYYESRGGWGDFDSAHETREAAVSRCEQLVTEGKGGASGRIDWAQCVDLETMEEIHESWS